jgi:hypothetical protein
VDALELTEFRRAVAALYRHAREESVADPEGAWLRWRGERDDLFARHPQSPVPEALRRGFGGMAFHPYDHRSDGSRSSVRQAAGCSPSSG